MPALSVDGPVQQQPEAGAVIHLDKMGKLMLHYIVLQMLRDEHEIQRQVDAAAAAAGTPACPALVDMDLRGMQIALFRHLPDSWNEKDLRMLTQAFLYLMLEPFLHYRTGKVHILGIICYELTALLTDLERRYMGLLQMEMETLGINAEVLVYNHGCRD